MENNLEDSSCCLATVLWVRCCWWSRSLFVTARVVASIFSQSNRACQPFQGFLLLRNHGGISRKVEKVSTRPAKGLRADPAHSWAVTRFHWKHTSKKVLEVPPRERRLRDFKGGPKHPDKTRGKFSGKFHLCTSLNSRPCAESHPYLYGVSSQHSCVAATQNTEGLLCPWSVIIHVSYKALWNEKQWHWITVLQGYFYPL